MEESREQMQNEPTARTAALVTTCNQLRGILAELRCLLNDGLNAMHRNARFAHISTFQSITPRDQNALVSWMVKAEQSSFEEIETFWVTQAFAYALRPVQDAVPGIEAAITTLGTHVHEPIPSLQVSHGPRDMDCILKIALKKQSSMVQELIKSGSPLCLSVEILRTKSDQTRLDMAEVGEAGIDRSNLVDGDGRTGQLMKIAEAITNKASAGAFESSWLRAPLSLLRTILAFERLDKTVVVSSQLDDVMLDLKKAFAMSD